MYEVQGTRYKVLSSPRLLAQEHVHMYIVQGTRYVYIVRCTSYCDVLCTSYVVPCTRTMYKVHTCMYIVHRYVPARVHLYHVHKSTIIYIHTQVGGVYIYIVYIAQAPPAHHVCVLDPPMCDQLAGDAFCGTVIPPHTLAEERAHSL